ncbi:MAG TPA: sensor histidine kinase [Terriglobales bacterium]
MLPLVALLVSSLSVGTWAQASKPLPTLTHADEIRHLSAEQAALGYPVRIRGVITDDVPAPDFFVQDSTAGVYVEGDKSAAFPHHLGDLVEVDGVTGPGKFAPVIRESGTRVLGKGTLPKARLYSFSELANGQLDSQWAQVRGIVRSVSIDRTSWRETILAMNVASGSGQLKVRVPIIREQDFSYWVDSEVLIEGVCGSIFNSDRQLLAVLFYVPRLSFIKMEAPAREVPFTALLRFSPDQGARHRVRVRGVVAHQQPGYALFIQNQGKGLRVLTQQDTMVKAGDVVDVLGFPAMGESVPVLEDAAFHRVSQEASPQPVPLDLSASWERYDGALVTSDFRLLQKQQPPEGLTFLLQQNDIVISASLAGDSERLRSLPLNSELRVTGICLVRSGGNWRVPESLRLLVRSEQDVAVLRAPSWWNFRHVAWLLGITAGVLLLVMAWVVVLRKQIRQQMDIIRQKLRAGAVLEERNRIARELHDTLEQELAAITMQLDLASDCFEQVPKIAQNALDTARKMSRHSMLGARRSVWDLRCHLLENGDLVSALTHAVAPLASAQPVKVDVKVTGTPTRLAAPAEMNLLRIGQEAVTNAVKHARAQHIRVELHFDPGKIRLCVTDDGKGFSLEEAALSGNGHFGLLDMRERAQAIGCHLEIDSTPGSGTRVVAEVSTHREEPLHAESQAHTHSGR